jgi:sodium-dependent phosphate transporter
MGFSLVYKGADGVVWLKSIPDFPYVAGFVPIVISWVSSPIICAAISAGIYSTIRYGIIKYEHAIQRSVYFLPVVVFFTFWIEFLFILSKGAGTRITWDIGTTVWVSFCIGAGASLLSLGFIPPLQKKIANYTPTVLPIEDKSLTEVKMIDLSGASVPTTDLSGARVDLSGVVLDLSGALVVKEHADDVYDPRIEYSFSYLQIFTSICTSFAHGANDVSNAVGPLAAIWYIHENGAVASKIEVPPWILALGGAGIVVGLATYGVKIMEVLGKKITYISPSRGFSAELATALVVSFASKYGLPISSTQCITGAVVGISLCDKNLKDLNWKIMGKIFVSWIFTILVTGAISAAVFSQGVYSPNM